jgi:hypothetical protein
MVYMRMFTHPVSLGKAARQKDIPAAEYWGRRLIALIVLAWAASFVVGFQAALSLLSVISLAATVVGVRWPTIGIFGIGMLFTLDAVMAPLLLTGGLLRWNTLNYWMLVVILLSMAFLLRLSDIQSRLLELFVLLLSLELLISPNKILGIQVVVAIVILFGILVYFARAAQDQSSWYWLGLICGVLGATGGLAFYLQQYRLPYINPNIASFFPLTALFALCMSFPFASRRGRMVLALLAVANFAWVFLSGSRGSLLVGSCCLLFLIVQTQGVSHRIAIVLIALLLGLVVSTQFTDLQAKALDRLDLLVNPARDSLVERTSGRSDLVLGGWYIFRDHPFGIGTGGFSVAWADLDYREDISNKVRGVEFPAHAGWIKILAENGIPGIALFGGYVVSFAVVGLFRRDRDVRALGVLATVVLGVAFTSVEFQWAKGLWFLAAGVTTLLHQEGIAGHVSGARLREPIRNIIRPKRIKL